MEWWGKLIIAFVFIVAIPLAVFLFVTIADVLIRVFDLTTDFFYYKHIELQSRLKRKFDTKKDDSEDYYI